MSKKQSKPVKKNIKSQKKAVKSSTIRVSPSSPVRNEKIRPLGNRILIRPFLKEDMEPKNSFGLILPGSDKKEKAEQGTVLAVGPGIIQDGKLVPVQLAVGDTVAFSKYGYD